MSDLPSREHESPSGLPTPTTQFRRRAWLLFQRALDPLAVPRPLPMRRRRR
jgi:hypothetical protein